MSEDFADEKRLQRGKYIEEHLRSVNLEPWFFIYEKYVKSGPKLKKKEEKEQS